MDNITTEIQTIPVEDFKALAETAPVALEKNTALVERARLKSQELKALLDERPMDDEVDQMLNDHMVKLSTAKEIANGRRAPFTRMIQGAVKVFTSIEKWFDDERAYFQAARDQYAQEKIRIKKEAEALAARKLAYDKEKVEVRSRLELEIQNNLLRAIESAKEEIIKNFNGITLENFEKGQKWFSEKRYEYTQVLFNAMSFRTGSPLLSGDDIASLEQEVKEGKFEQFKARYEEEVSDFLQIQGDRLVGKKKELEEMAAKAAEVAKLQAEAKTKAQKEAAAKAAAEAEKQKQEAEARKRQQEQEQAAAAEKARREAQEKVELEKDVAMTNTLFDHESSNAVASADAPEGREGYEITVVHPAGYIELVNLWWKNEGSKLGIADVPALEKKTFKQLKTFAEKIAHKNDIRIESKFVVYTETFKTQAKK